MNGASSSPVSVLLITGTVGVGKSALAREIGELLRRGGAAGAVIDLDALSYACSGPVEDRFNSGLVLANLKAIWPNYAVRGVRYLVLARYVGAADELLEYHEAIPAASLMVCRVTSPAETVWERLRRREVGLERDFSWACRRSWPRGPKAPSSRTSSSRTVQIGRSLTSPEKSSLDWAGR